MVELEVDGVSKAYPGVNALADVSLRLHGGEILALLGENGARKSTLVKVLAGAVAPDAGTIRFNGAPLSLRSPLAARRAGIAVIYQEFNLIPRLTVAENIFLGQDLARGGWLWLGEERRRARDLLARLGVDLALDARCGELSVAQQQVVEIAKALATEARILILDEPSAALTLPEIECLFGILRDLKRRGLGIIYISHRLDEVFALADRVQVLRDGRHVAEASLATGAPWAVTRQQLIEWLVGRRIDQEFPPRRRAPGEPRLVVQDLRRGNKVKDVSFHVRRGEVLGLTGLVGAGRTETARLIFGADPRDGGTIALDGRLLSLRSPRDAIRARICCRKIGRARAW